MTDLKQPPDRIWIDAWGGNWSPQAGGTQESEYVRADLCTPAPDVSGLLAALRAIIARWDTPAWKDAEPTGAVIERARAELAKWEGR